MADERYELGNEVEDDDIITLEYDDGTTMECEIQGVFPLGDKDYVALIPHDDSDDVYIYRYQEYDDGTFDIDSIEDDAEFKKAAMEYDAIMASQDDDEPEE
ncbi:MAG: DUF1292 domain-containing protein [Eubacterium sp.]|nr:DUF1292 domain-containing protein [Eubacterium sp.]MCI2197951.1 DUF1292 domain-containing protein [Eubacterium sp.]